MCCGNGFGGGCSWIIILIILFLCCGNGWSSFNNGCGCGCNDGCGCNNGCGC